MLHAMFVSHELWASWEIVYQNVKDTYVDNITIQEIASSALKGLSNADKNLTVGGGVNTITLYGSNALKEYKRKKTKTC